GDNYISLSICNVMKSSMVLTVHISRSFFFFFKQKTAYEIGLGIPAEPLFRSILNFLDESPERKTSFIEISRGGKLPYKTGSPAISVRSEERFSRNAETDLVCRLLLEKKKKGHHYESCSIKSPDTGT